VILQKCVIPAAQRTIGVSCINLAKVIPILRLPCTIGKKDVNETAVASPGLVFEPVCDLHKSVRGKDYITQDIFEYTNWDLKRRGYNPKWDKLSIEFHPIENKLRHAAKVNTVDLAPALERIVSEIVHSDIERARQLVEETHLGVSTESRPLVIDLRKVATGRLDSR
jgi:hypothetical protein